MLWWGLAGDKIACPTKIVPGNMQPYAWTGLAAVAAIVAALSKLLPIVRQWWDRRTLLELSG